MTAMVVAGALRPAPAQVIVAGPTTSDLDAVLGNRVTVPVAIDMTGASGFDLGAYRVRFTWNPNVFSYVSASGGTFAAPVFNADTAAAGVLRFAAASAAGANGLFTLADITLEVLATDPDTFRVQFEELTAAGTFDDLLPFLTVTSGAFCGSGVWGDLDGNGQVQSVDAQIVLMHAVGIAVTDTVRGDVDADAKVDPRDALIILSDVVGLDVSAFRVGQLVAATCRPGATDTVTVLPSPLTLAPGDLFALSAQVRDTAGILLGGIDLAWSSTDPSVATVDATGTVTAVAQGSADIVAAVAPGVTGGTTVTVGDRHRWVVNPTGAQGQQAEVGSDLHPFSTISEAVARAADGDTVFLHAHTYTEPLEATKPLVFLGDTSGARPTITTPNRSVGTIDATGAVTLRHLAFREASGGLDIRADTLTMRSVEFRSLSGPGLRARGTEYAALDSVFVSGVLGGGIGLDTAGVVSILRSRVAGVEKGVSDTVYGFFVRADTARFDVVEVAGVMGEAIVTHTTPYTSVQRTTIVDADGGVFADTGVTLDVRNQVRLKRLRFGGIGGAVDTLRVADVTADEVGGATFFAVDLPYHVLDVAGVTVSNAAGGVFGDTGRRAAVHSSQFSAMGLIAIDPNADTLVIDTVTVDGASTSAVWLEGAHVTYVSNSQFVNTNGGIAEFGTGGYLEVTGSSMRGMTGFAEGIRFAGDSLLVLDDTIVGVPRDIGIYHLGGSWLRMRNSLVRRTGYEGVQTSGVALVDIAHVTVDSASVDCAGCYWGIEVSNADSARVDSSAVRDNKGGAVYAAIGRAFTMQDDTLTGNFTTLSQSGGHSGYYVVHVDDIDDSRVVGNHIASNRAAGIYFSFSSADDTALVENNLFRGRYQGIEAVGWDTLTTRVDIRNNTFASDLAGFNSEQIGVGWVKTLVVENNVFDSIVGAVTDVWSVDSMRVVGNTTTNLRGTSSTAHSSSGGRETVIDGNAVTCADTNSVTGVYHANGAGLLSNNTVTGCYQGAWFHNGLYATQVFDLAVRGNTITQGSAVTAQRWGIHLQGGSYNAELVGNSVTGGTYTTGAISVVGNTTYPHPRVRVDSNAVTGGAGIGIRISEADTALVDSNTVSGLAATATAREGAVTLANVYHSTAVTNNKLSGNAVPGVFVDATVGGTVVVDTNLIVDNTGSGIMLLGAATGTLNSIRRNTPFGIIDSVGTGAVFQANNIEGNAVGVMNLGLTALDATNSWWGDVSGPDCDTCAAGLGDSVSANVTYIPFATASIVGAPAGAPPVFALAPAQTVALRRTASEPGREPEPPTPVHARRERTTPAPALQEPPPARPRVLRNGAIEPPVGAVTPRERRTEGGR